MHAVANRIESATTLPFLHIDDAMADEVQRRRSLRRLAGDRFTMEQPFFRDRLESHGIIREESREKYREAIASLAQQGAQSVILGCTEIGLLIQPGDAPLPVHDTTVVHALAAVAWALR